MAAAVEEAVGTGGLTSVVAQRPVGDGSPGTADAVNPEGVERIVIADLGLDDGDGDVADDTADGADEKGRKGW